MADWRLTPENTAIVVVDVQEKLLPAIPNRSDVIAAIQKLLGVARVINVPIVMTVQYVKGLGPMCPEILEAAPGVAVIEKMAFSCCGTEPFVTAVRNLRRQRLIVCGLEAHVCIQ